MNDEIINDGDQLRTVTGKGVTAFRLKAIWLGLRFRKQTGTELDRRFNIRKIAKAETGLKTNDIDKLMNAIADKMNAVIAECHVSNLQDKKDGE